MSHSPVLSRLNEMTALGRDCQSPCPDYIFVVKLYFLK